MDYGEPFHVETIVPTDTDMTGQPPAIRAVPSSQSGDPVSAPTASQCSHFGNNR